MKIIACNWKMNKNIRETDDFFNKINDYLRTETNFATIIAPSFVCLQNAIRLTNRTEIFAQNCHWEESGAFTGEVSPKTLKEIGVSGVILGHSERKKFGENENIINKKIKSALKFNLKVIFCIGETLKEYQKNKTEKIIKFQINSILKDITLKNNQEIIIAYEPLWAIGAKNTAKIEDIEKNSINIKLIASKTLKKPIKVIYGGSVNNSNIKEILNNDNINGVLIGSASLDPDNFIKFIS